MLNISTLLTIFRIFVTPIIIYQLINGQLTFAFVLFIFAAISDVLDGYLARILNQVTVFGSYLDPFADKILVTITFFTLAFIKTDLYKIPKWFVFLLLFKELILIAGAAIFFLQKHSFVIKPTILGKTLTFFETLFIALIFCKHFFDLNLIKNYFLIIISVLLVITLLHYIFLGIKQYRSL